MRKLVVPALAAALLLIAIGWPPWLTEGLAERRAEASFTSSWAGVVDGCGLDCQGCGARESRRVPFGYRVTLEFGCGLLPADLLEYHQRATGFVSFIGTVHGFPAP